MAIDNRLAIILSIMNNCNQKILTARMTKVLHCESYSPSKARGAQSQ